MKKNPYQFTIRFNSTIAGHCQAAAFLNRCGTRAKAHVLIISYPCTGEKKADQKAIPKPEPVVYAPEVEALNEEDLDAIAASLGAWDMEN